MKKCPYCAEEIRDDAAICRFCGKKLKTPKSYSAKRNLRVALILVGLVFLINFFVMFLNNDEPLPIEKSAWYSCESAIGKNLKAPTTASYQRYTEENVTKLGDYAFRIIMYVDAENSFGAMIRSEFICEIEFSEDRETYTAKVKER